MELSEASVLVPQTLATISAIFIQMSDSLVYMNTWVGLAFQKGERKDDEVTRVLGWRKLGKRRTVGGEEGILVISILPLKFQRHHQNLPFNFCPAQLNVE